MRNKKKNKKMLLLLLLLAISVGFAALATTLKINGSTNITKQTWDIYWDNASIVPTTNLENADITKAAQTKTGDVTTLEWTVNLNLPGDYYEFTVDAVNNGTIDAMITEIDSKIGNSSIISTEEGQLVVADPSPVPSYINYDVTYEDGTPLALNHLLAKKTNNTPTREKYKVRVEYDRDAVENSDIAAIPSAGLSLTFTFSVKYGQADNTAVPSHSNTIASCPGCVYAYYTSTKIFGGEDADVLNDYTNDYTTLNKNIFLGHILDANGKISRAFACQIKNDTPYCIEGAYNPDVLSPSESASLQEILNANKTLLQSEDIWNNTCEDGQGGFICGTQENGAAGDDFGGVFTRGEQSSCDVNYTG